VLTLNAILAQAASLDGNEVKSYDQTGAAQKWGPVLSSLIISPPGQPALSHRVGQGKAQLYLALDLLAAVDKVNLSCCKPGVTRAVINADVMPNPQVIQDPRIILPKQAMLHTIGEATCGADVVVDARRIAEGLLGDYVMTNMVATGVACQAGLLPISAASIETAIRMNGQRVDDNLLAFRAGRLFVHDPAALDAMLHKPYALLADRLEENRRQPAPEAAVQALMSQADIPGASDVLLAQLQERAVDLLHYQDADYAADYIRRVNTVAQAERAALGEAGGHALTLTALRNLHKLMAYKDEYEVARLLSQQTFRERVQAMFTGPVRLKVNLQPPLLRWFGLKRKVALGEWFRPVLALLAKGKRLRGTRLDPFGYLKVRRAERAILRWYLALIDQALTQLDARNVSALGELLALPDGIRGYEDLKRKNFQTAQEQAARILDGLAPGSSPKRVIPVQVSL
jgi:indolepyruvate ferredoxin oxidoreductase